MASLKITLEPESFKQNQDHEGSRPPNTPGNTAEWTNNAGLTVLVEVVLDRTNSNTFQLFAKAIKSMPEVLECYMVGGGFDYLSTPIEF